MPSVPCRLVESIRKKKYDVMLKTTISREKENDCVLQTGNYNILALGLL